MGKQWQSLFSWAPKSLHEINAPWKKSYDQPRELIKKQRHYFDDKGPSSQSYDFPSSHVWMWELDHKESWAPKNWCFWTVVLEKTLEIQLVNRKVNLRISFSNSSDTYTSDVLWLLGGEEFPFSNSGSMLLLSLALQLSACSGFWDQSCIALFFRSVF